MSMLHGLKDIETVISNKRKIGGAAEAAMLKLTSGEVFHHPVFTNIDKSKGQYVSLCFIDVEGMNVCIHVDQIAIMKGLKYKLICQLNNERVKQLMLTDTLQYLQRLCELNDGFVTPTFKKEALVLVRDISVKELEKENVILPFSIDDNLIQFNRKFA
ncbi:hypothetical protein RRV45_18805 [Bacillus sp. DTU_2020_1000418_1_SI_GHA_SEK_038]|uniref:hypothetical protein n=1 Tax=Bacillus sp. DTU_2020_1000418_1_SI_GHA_SEK_038 TaxID=3077585 RepID=UPI0028E5E6E7|nr:hypothetical protein [Bacillus sp. DTU_2020_1000418_1_SI_GHA_SEK_038]WNS74909.1 hypothetical protein RRV45_18805 [Bacillus sp. DTU_2020_1000418_1_SI_GHA_SEK_038]